MSRKRKLSGVGGKLKDARERRGISLREIADSTKISVGVLQSLERNDISQLPGGVLGRGFVRSFAAAVHLDPEAIVAEFVAQFPTGALTEGYLGAEAPERKDASDTRAAEVPIKIHRWEPSLRLRVGAIGVLAAALVAYVGTTPRWPQWAAAVQGKASLADAPEHVPPPREVPAPPAVAAPATPPAQNANTMPASDTPPVVPAAPAAVVSTSLVPAQTPNMELKAQPPAAVEPSRPVEHVPATAPPAPAAAPATAAVTNSTPGSTDAAAVGTEQVTVVLSVRSPSWVIAVLDGKRIVNRLFEAGEQETIRARGDLVLTAGDGGAIAMTLNGILAKRLGRDGETVKVIVNPANFRDYLRSDESPRDSP